MVVGCEVGEWGGVGGVVGLGGCGVGVGRGWGHKRVVGRRVEAGLA